MRSSFSPSLPNTSPLVNRFSQMVIGESSHEQQQEREISDILPSELWLEILVHLPVRTLLTLKSVSKSFLSLIQNPNFTSLHFTRFNNNFSDPKGSHFTLFECPEDVANIRNFVICRSDEIDTPINESTQFDEVPVYWAFGCDVIDYVNGLLLVRRFDLDPDAKYLILWNPSIRKSFNIPVTFDCNLRWAKLGFGYDNVSDDFKVVAIEYTRFETIVKVYSLRNGCWRSIGVDVIDGSWYLKDHVFVNGSVHWTAVRCDDDSDDYPDTCQLSHIVSFDLGTELFSYTMLPDLDELERVRFPLLFDGSLAVVSFSSIHICLWVMRETDWCKEYEAEVNPKLFDHLVDYIGDITNVIFSKKTCELLLCVRWEGLLLYKTETQQIRNYDFRAAYVATYTESLFWRDLLPPLDPIARAEE